MKGRDCILRCVLGEPVQPDCIDRLLTTGVRPYRPPELLFGTRDYDPYAVDMWSIGCVLAEFYTPFQFNDETRRKERQTLFNAPSELGELYSLFTFHIHRLYGVLIEP
jgi:serine/threonine protein kinase